MTIEMINNKADFQRHLNGCEKRLNSLTKSLHTIEKLSQNLLLKNNPQKQELYFNGLNDIISQMKILHSTMIKLNECSYSCNGTKRLNYLKINLEKNQFKLEQIQKYAQMKLGYEYQQNDIEQQEQSIKLINKHLDEEQIELEYLNEFQIQTKTLERSLNDIKETFVDLNRIVHEQSTMVNNIEQALTSADNMVCEATENVETTVQVRKRSKHIKWILISIIIGAFLFLITIIYVTLKLAIPIH